ncbi:sensor histidine kinase [Prevotella sp.]|uniref:sensor histidine kinase n=1 Tax=Prevotella sp. TaxID=59823 RepID=UPI003077E3EF
MGLLLLLLILIILFIRHQRLLSLRARLMREALRNHDFTFRLPTTLLFPGERDLQNTLNEMGSEINRLLARSEVESWRRLTRVLTHEIMNSVAPIQSITQAYIASPMVKGTPLEEGMKAIYDTSLSLATFVDSYRKLTQLQPADIQPVDLQQFVTSIPALYPDIQWHISLNTPTSAKTDLGMLRQVMTNIIKNAIEAEANSVDIRLAQCSANDNLQEEDTTLQLLVSNDGQAIAAEVAREIFIPFFTTKKKGQGIGLAIARQMMMACGGNLWLADTPVAGYHTTFVVEVAG